MSKMDRRQAGKKGGLATAAKLGSKFFAEIGKKGGTAVSRNREHMASIGRKGGRARRDQG